MNCKLVTSALFLALFAAPAILRAAAPAMKVMNLLTTEQDFRRHWIKGNGTVAYDPGAKVVHVFAVGGPEIGGFSYDAPWSQAACTVAIDKPRIADQVRLFVVINGQKIDLTSIIKQSGTHSFRATLGRGKDVGLFVDNKFAGKATLKSDNTLRFIFESEFEDGGTLHFANVQVVAAPEPGPPPVLPDQKNPGPMKLVPLLQTQDDLQKHFHKGQGNVELDPKTKIITFEKTSDWDIGDLLYQAQWSELQFDIAIDNQPHISNKQPSIIDKKPSIYDKRFLLSFGGECFELTPLIPSPGQYRIKAVYIKNKTLAVSVNGRLVTPVATILDNADIVPLKLRIYTTYKGTFRLGNFKINALDEK